MSRLILSIFPNNNDDEPEEQLQDINLALTDIASWAKRVNSIVSSSGIVGPAGPTGPQGPIGVTGPAGPMGTNNIQAWVNFSGVGINGAAPLNSASGVSSVTRNSAGLYSVAFTTNFANTNYGYNITSNSNGTSILVNSLYGTSNKTVSGCQIAVYNLVALADPYDTTATFYSL